MGQVTASASRTNALVPRVYLAPKTGNLAQSGQLFGGGAVISANQVRMALSGDLSNSGTIAERWLLDISAKNIEDTGLMQGVAVKAWWAALTCPCQPYQGAGGVSVQLPAGSGRSEPQVPDFGLGWVNFDFNVVAQAGQAVHQLALRQVGEVAAHHV